MDSQDLTTKQCLKCLQYFPPTEEYFRIRYRRNDGTLCLRTECKECSKAYGGKHYQENKVSIAESGKEKRGREREARDIERLLHPPILPTTRQCSKCEQVFPLTFEYFYHDGYKKDGSKRFRAECRECSISSARVYVSENKERISQYRKNYRLVNKEEIALYMHAYQENNKETLAVYSKEYRQENKEILALHDKKWRTQNIDTVREKQRERSRQFRATVEGREKAKVASQRHAARKKALPDTLTAEEWLWAVAYWGGCCAVCGKQEGFWSRGSLDHWIPMADPACPGTVADNVLPLCSGLDGCNNIKHDRDAWTFLVERLGSRKAKAKRQEIEAYFAAVRARRTP